jgi:hypothetical protein
LAFVAARVFSPLILEPLKVATGHLVSDRVEKGLEELSPEKLRAGLTLAVSAVASYVSIKPIKVETLLPMGEVNAALARIGTSQPLALAAWRRYAGGLGGLLGRSSEAFDEAPASTSGNRLAALANTMQRDKMLSDPLRAVAEDVAAWEAIVNRIIDIISGSKELLVAYRIRQGKRAALLATIAAILIVIAIISRALWVARANVTAAIAKPDPCVVFELSEVDLGRVSAELRGQADEKRRVCEANRAEEARRIEEERLRKEREEAARKAKEKLEADCDALATHVEAGKLGDQDGPFANDAGLTARIASGDLEAKDFGPDDPKIPCVGTKAEKRLWEAFNKGVLAKPWILLTATAPSPRVRAALNPAGSTLPFKLRKVVATRANDYAKFAIRSGKVEDATKASAWCEVARSVGMPMAGPCDTADKLAGKAN